MSNYYIYKSKLTHKRNKYIEKYKKKFSNSKWEKHINEQLKIVNKIIKNKKKELLLLLKSNNNIRQLNKDYLIDKNIISVFESTLTRLLKIPTDTLSQELIIVQTYYFDIIEDIILNGFILGKEKYVCLTASAGQIRTKKTVFIKENSLKNIEKSLTCGLTIEKINENGGININKYLAYLALNNSATDYWEDFDINRTIVVDDFETFVEGEVDLIDDETYSVQRKIMKVPIPHTDGCGMMLPRVGKKCMMVRLPWVKGLLVPFPFDKFIREKSKEGKYCGVIRDIYGQEHDILKEKIDIIFTASQFKMHKYYKNIINDNNEIIKYGWEIYKDNFKSYKCQAGTCNVEEDKFTYAKLNYQMIQTLTDITDDELKKICDKTIKDIKNIGNNREIMLKILGVTESNINKNYMQQALEIYPELLNDKYNREILKKVKKSKVKKAKAGKIDINGIYTFIAPDLYAFCEWLFLDIENPKGLLENKEVWCNIYKNKYKLDCLRSPHLYREHAVRKNIAYKKGDKERIKEIKRWFITNALYTSTHDIISKILMFDVDGDKSLVCAEDTFVKVAERNMRNIVPLYYNMRKAEPEIINKHSIFKGLKTAYTNGNIGIYSNDISKIWNSDNVNLDVIKILCMENNFTIDFAKTLYKPIRPLKKKKLITGYTKKKVPHFFIYAKDKKKQNVEEINDSTVNKLGKLIPSPRLSFKASNLGNFDYKMLMHNKNIKIKKKDNKIINKYIELDLKKPFIINKVNDEKTSNILFLYKKIRKQLLEVNNDEKYVTDILVKYLYGKKNSKYKTTLWECFGNVMVENLKINTSDKDLKNGYIQCEICGERVKDIMNNKKYCKKCAKEIKKKQDRIADKKYKKREKSQLL